ncbi:uncharacterized protein LOC115237639 [Formica exsecta]|uniref:uncharacterized protein LOC115237639 n=1 Tax=Formica exsecta TaxID=72781 RepID=UPI001141F88C|nr:uncharacterized protein LOC115237639 [Formica exsecta]
MASRRGKTLLRRIFRRIAIRVIRGYRTVSHAAASVLAELPPIELYAQMYAEVYRRTKELDGLGVVLIPRVRAAVRLQARRRMLERWIEDLSNPRNNSGRRVVKAIRPRLIKWVERADGEMSYRVAQVFTSHGCFGSYLCRIGREMDARYHHCGRGEDTAQHTLEDYPAWANERRALVQQLRSDDLSLSSVITTMLEGEES